MQRYRLTRAVPGHGEGSVIDSSSWPSEAVWHGHRTGLLDPVTVSPGGAVHPTPYRAAHLFKVGEHRYAPGDVLPGVREWPSFRTLLLAGWVEVAPDAAPVPTPPVQPDLVTRPQATPRNRRAAA